MTGRVPQLNDDVLVTVVLPAATEEWADEELAKETGMTVERDSSDRLVVRARIGGNTNAISVAKGVLDTIENLLFDCQVDPMDFELTAVSAERRA